MVEKTKDKDMSEIEVTDIVVEGIELERSWEGLPGELLSEIFSRVSVDRHHLVFCLVCKSWNSILQSPKPTKHQLQLISATNCSYPHLFLTNNELIHPILKKVSKLKKFPERTLGVQLCCANEDWLLFEQNRYRKKPAKAFFFNPFTQTMVWLPDLLQGRNSMWFSSPPTSADWKLVVVRNYFPIISIDTINCGEDRWSSCDFECEDRDLFEFTCCNPCLYEGKYYIFGKKATLLIHDPKEKTFLPHKAPDCVFWSNGEQYMMESDGKLLAVFASTDGSCVVVCQWNITESNWEKIESLGNKVLFVSRPYSVSETVDARGVKNAVYFPRVVDDRCLFYSLETNKFYTSDGRCFTSFDGTQSAFSSTWIKLANNTG